MSEREPFIRVNLEELVTEHINNATGAVGHTFVGIAVGAGIIGIESVRTGKKVVEASGRLGLKAAAVVFSRNGHS
jgi:hypothetical protein